MEEISLAIMLAAKRSAGVAPDVNLMEHVTCVTAAGWWAGNTQFTFVLARVRSGLCTCQVITATQSVTVMNTISILWVGTH